MPNFLLEIGTEELPAAFINPALQSLAESFSTLLRDNNLSFSNVKTLGTPRRLAIFVADLPLKQPDQTKEVSGPRESAAFDPAGKPTPALIGFARRYRLKPDEVKVMLKLAQAYEDSEQYPQAKDLYERIMKIDPDNKKAKDGFLRMRVKEVALKKGQG